MQENHIHNQVRHQLPNHCQATIFKSENFRKSWKNKRQIRKPQKLLEEKTFKKKVAFEWENPEQILEKNVHMNKPKNILENWHSIERAAENPRTRKEKKGQDKTRQDSRQDSQNDWDDNAFRGKKTCPRYPQVLCHGKVSFCCQPSVNFEPTFSCESCACELVLKLPCHQQKNISAALVFRE